MRLDRVAAGPADDITAEQDVHDVASPRYQIRQRLRAAFGTGPQYC
jgi:hypothetical protein